MTVEEGQDLRFPFVGNLLCVDFVNTRIMEDGRMVDLLEGPADLARWLAEAGVTGEGEAERSLEEWYAGPGGRRVFERALALRKALHELVEALVEGRPVPDAAVDEINAELRARPGYPQVESTPEGAFAKRFRAERDEPLGALAEVANSAADLLVGGDASLLKECENPDCVLHFYDTSKNHSRRWCSMALCGNRMKAQAHYRRNRDSRG